MECSICHGKIDEERLRNGEVYWDKGHNAWPVMEGRCCSVCNDTVVIRARLNVMGKQLKENEDVRAE